MTLSHIVPTNSVEIIPNSNITSGGVVLKLGGGYLWFDATGDLRTSGANATGDLNGTVVGSQS